MKILNSPHNMSKNRILPNVLPVATKQISLATLVSRGLIVIVQESILTIFSSM